MKKIILLNLIILLICFSAVNAFAAGNPVISNEHVYVATGNDYPKEIYQVSGNIAPVIEPGSIIYFKIDNAKRAEDLIDFYPMRGILEGYQYIGVPSLEYRMLYNEDGTQIDYSYVIALPILEVNDTAKHKASGYIALNENVSTRFNFSLFIQKNAAFSDAEQYLCSGKNLPLDLTEKKNYACFTFDEGITFTVDVTSQGKINLGFSTDPIENIINANPRAKIKCLEWTHSPIFNREGILEIPSPSTTLLYEYANGTIYNISKYYDEESLSFIIPARKLGTLILSDRGLQIPSNSFKKVDNPLTGVPY